MLDRKSQKPLFLQTKNDLEDKIAEMSPNTKIDSEPELAEKYDVSRGTVRKALGVLSREGKVYRIPKKGTYVAAKKIKRHFNKLPSYSEDIKKRGLEPGAYLVEFAQIVPQTKVRDLLNLGEDDKAWKIKRIRTADETPIILTTSYLPVNIFPVFTKSEVLDSLYDAMEEKYNNRPFRAREKYSAVNPDHVIASLLNIDENQALIFSERLSFSRDDRPIEYAVSYTRGDKYEIHVEVTPSGLKSINDNTITGGYPEDE